MSLDHSCRRRQIACHGVQSAEKTRRRSASPPKAPVGRIVAQPHPTQRLCRPPMRPQPLPGCRRVCAEPEDVVGDRDQPVQIKRARTGLSPAREHPVVAGRDHLAQFPRERPRVGSEHRHRREQPVFLVVEVEMPGNGVGSPRRCAEPPDLAGRAAHRQEIAQPVGVGERQGRVRDPRARKPLAGPGRARLCSVLAAHRSSSPAGLSTTMRARRR